MMNGKKLLLVESGSGEVEFSVRGIRNRLHLAWSIIFHGRVKATSEGIKLYGYEIRFRGGHDDDRR